MNLPGLSQVQSVGRKPNTRGIIVWGLLAPRWLVFLLPAAAEGRSTSGMVEEKKSRPSQVDAAVESEDEPSPKPTSLQLVTPLPPGGIRRFFPRALLGGVGQLSSSTRQRLNL